MEIMNLVMLEPKQMRKLGYELGSSEDREDGTHFVIAGNSSLGELHYFKNCAGTPYLANYIRQTDGRFFEIESIDIETFSPNEIQDFIDRNEFGIDWYKLNGIKKENE